jgi:phosphopentomutase
VGFIFTNLVDTDMLWGHRRNVQGYAQSLEEIDLWLGKIMQSMGDDDLLLISSDHGNDPTAPGTDHTREYVPIIAYSPSFASVDKKRLDIGVRKGFVDVAQSVASWFDIEWTASGKSFLPEAVKAG